MRRAVGEAEARLRRAHRIREDAAAGHHHDIAANGGERGEAGREAARAQEAAAELENDHGTAPREAR